MPIVTFKENIRDGFRAILAKDPKVFIIGVGVTSSLAVHGTLTGLLEEFGPQRIMEAPLSETMLTGLVLGAALEGMKPILIHGRIDFSLLGMDQLVNHIAKWRYMFGDDYGHRLPIMIRGLVGRGWGVGPQHTQSLQGLMASIPGIRVVVPGTPRDAKNMILDWHARQQPTIYIDHKELYEYRSDYEDSKEEGYGMSRTSFIQFIGMNMPDLNIKTPHDLTMIATGPFVPKCMESAQILRDKGHKIIVINLNVVQPIQYESICHIVRDSGRLLICDSDHEQSGVSNKLIAHFVKWGIRFLCYPEVIAWPDHPVPASHKLENNYYSSVQDIVDKAEKMLNDS